jgi:hypothetical protein
MKILFTRILNLLGAIFLICIVSAAVDTTFSWRVLLFGATEAKLFGIMENLDECDRVELYRLGQETNDADGDTFPIRAYKSQYKVEAVIVLSQEQAAQIISLWKNQTFDIRLSALCHKPALGYRFYRNNKLVFETSVCWECYNFSFTTLKFIHGFWGFDANNNAGKTLFNVSTEMLKQANTDG